MTTTCNLEPRLIDTAGSAASEHEAARPNGRVNPWSGMAAVVISLIAAMTPVFAVAALATPIERGLHLSGSTFGLILSGFYALTALGSLVAARLTARIPVPVALAASCGTAAMALLLAPHGGAALVSAMLLAGAGNALTQPAAARYITARVPGHRLSLATGLTGAALGAAPLLPGLLAGLVAGPYGWRSALTIAAVFPLLAALGTPLTRLGQRAATPSVAVSRPDSRVGPTLLLWTLGAALATIGSNGVASFFVQIGTTSGLSTTVAGTLLSLASVLAIVVRVVAGTRADRAPERNPKVVALLMLSGVAGLVLISLNQPATFIAGAALAVAGGWGWTGLLLTAVLRLLPGQATRAGATIQIGLFSGATLAPLTFGALLGDLGVGATVLVAAGTTLLGTIAVRSGAALLKRPAHSSP